MFILNSYYWLREKGSKLDAWMKKIEKHNLKLLIDSGAFSVFNAKQKGKEIKEITVEEYADFINRYKNSIYAFFNLDVIGNAAASKKNYVKLTELTNRKAIPIWHCNIDDWRKSDFDLLDKMVAEDHEVIGIGATVQLGMKAGPMRQNQVKRELFTEIFKRHPKQNFHWLGGSSHLLLEFPFFSSDSSGWIQGRKKHQIYILENSEKSTKIMLNWTKEKCLNFNIKKLSSLEQLYDGLQLDLELIA